MGTRKPGLPDNRSPETIVEASRVDRETTLDPLSGTSLTLGSTLLGETPGPMDETSRVGVVRRQGQFSLVATETIARGRKIFQIEGERTQKPTRYSVQIDENVHIDLGEYPLEVVLDRYYWRFMNHHCEPSAVLRGQEVYALRSIAMWEEITFDYDTTEYEMAEAFACGCGSERCREVVRGFKSLSSAERQSLRPWLAPYLLRLLET